MGRGLDRPGAPIRRRSQPVSEQKSEKSRVHVDLHADDMAAEVARLEGLGAQRLRANAFSDTRWTVMADPEGNEFCVVQFGS